MATTNLSTLKINFLTQEQYNTAVTENTINENELYLTPSGVITLNGTEISSSANFYAPTTAGTSGYYLKSNGANAAPTWAVPTDNKVTQTATTTSSSYEVLFSATADNTTRTEGARKSNKLTFNPSTGLLTANKGLATTGDWDYQSDGVYNAYWDGEPSLYTSNGHIVGSFDIVISYGNWGTTAPTSSTPHPDAGALYFQVSS